MTWRELIYMINDELKLGSDDSSFNEEHIEEDIPAGAKYITRSYGFYGTANVGAIESLGSDMMHIVVKVRTDITTKHQDIVFMIPASLIPVITYHVELNSDDYATATEFKMYKDEQKPIRLLFEVGLRSDINELNITEMLADCELSLPISPTMTMDEAVEVVRLVNAFSV